MTRLAVGIATSRSGDGALMATATGSGSSARALMRVKQAVGGWGTVPTNREVATEDAMWESVAMRHADAIDRLFASLDQQMAKGEDEALDLDKL